MGRAPCCEKMGLKKGPWTPDEDHILVNYIRLHGHNNWRALPKQAGLLRCGKSCRLRWTNYLRPDIKRGNFTQDEEETIIKLHEMLGNRWSAIAARLPGRTDNEIKNVWHTHLKKRLPLKLEVTSSPINSGSTPTPTATTSTSSSVATAAAAAAAAINVAAGPTRKRSRKTNVSKRNVAPKKRVVPKHENSMEPSGNDERTSDTAIIVKVIKTEPCTSDVSTSDVSTVTSTSTTTNTTTTTTSTTTATTNSTSENDNDARLEDNAGGKQDDDVADVPEINDDFWMEVLSVEDTAMSTEDLPCITMSDDHILVTEPFVKMEYPSDNCEDMDVFWHNLLTKSHEILEITEMV